MNVNIVKHKNIWLGFSSLLVIVSIVALAVWQLKFGIDFTGGSLLEVVYGGNRPSSEEVINQLKKFDLKELEVKPAGEKVMIFRTRTLDEETHQKVFTELKKNDATLVERSFDSIGPVIGAELRGKSLWAVTIALLLILGYITYAFRRVSFPVASWKYGASAILALFHDLLTTVGVFAILGHFAGVEITSSFIPAFLTVLGFSVHDTIVVFDRIRENLTKYKGEFHEIVNKSLNETLVRSINTSLTVLLVLLAIFFFGGETIKQFSLTLLIGIALGTYSSIFVASPLLVVWHNLSKKKR